ncbi:MAG: class I SAM-dependent methyltransferase [Paludibacteraceae bacterium]|nr:class I SAM-dependent methyltransferase [Paludibacteraceae bacterium]
MTLNKKIEERYTSDSMTAREAQERALLYSWAPAVFEASRLLIDWGILAAIDKSEKGLTVEEIGALTGHKPLAISSLVEAGLTCSILFIDASTDRYRLTKLGWFLLNDEMTHVNFDFNHSVNYRSFYLLDKALEAEEPKGLQTISEAQTIYEALPKLDEHTRQAWLNYDHFYSDRSFEQALPFVLASHPKTLLDVGGNTGEMALQLVSKDPDIHVTVCDLPEMITMMKEAIAGQPGAERISGLSANLLDETQRFTSTYDAIWMSQFIMCFPETEIDAILRRVTQAMHKDSRLYLMEVLWNRQSYPAAAFCQTMNSLYFIATASGNNKMLVSDCLLAHLSKAGLELVSTHDQMGPGGHTLMILKKI